MKRPELLYHLIIEVAGERLYYSGHGYFVRDIAEAKFYKNLGHMKLAINRVKCRVFGKNYKQNEFKAVIVARIIENPVEVVEIYSEER
jgi:hypothetical protein